MREVILAHGLWEPGLVMRLLAARLERAGFRCRNFAYLGRAKPIEAHAEQLARLARAAGPAHFVGHSLGGLVVLEALQSDPTIATGRVVLLGTPARGCMAGRRLAKHAAGRWLMGESEKVWREGRVSRWTRAEHLGVIAGVRPIGLGRILGRIAGPNDGVVGLDETTIEGMSDRITLPVGHSQLLFSRRVAEQAAAFLRNGAFLHDVS